jgi:hypothetical protein
MLITLLYIAIFEIVMNLKYCISAFPRRYAGEDIK